MRYIKSFKTLVFRYIWPYYWSRWAWIILKIVLCTALVLRIPKYTICRGCEDFLDLRYFWNKIWMFLDLHRNWDICPNSGHFSMYAPIIQIPPKASHRPLNSKDSLISPGVISSDYHRPLKLLFPTWSLLNLAYLLPEQSLLTWLTYLLGGPC